MSTKTVAEHGAVDLVEMTVGKAQAAFAKGTLTSEALTGAFLARIAVYNPAY